MKLPMCPPSAQNLLGQLSTDELSLLLQNSSALPTGKYLHWDELRHRTPPAGLSLENWWLSVWLARGSMLHELPFTDKEGNPFRLATPEPLLIHLHHIDRDAAGQIRTPEAAPTCIADPCAEASWRDLSRGKASSRARCGLSNGACRPARSGRAWPALQGQTRQCLCFLCRGKPCRKN